MEQMVGYFRYSSKRYCH